MNDASIWDGNWAWMHQSIHYCPSLRRLYQGSSDTLGPPCDSVEISHAEERIIPIRPIEMAISLFGSRCAW